MEFLGNSDSRIRSTCPPQLQEPTTSGRSAVLGVRRNERSSAVLRVHVAASFDPTHFGHYLLQPALHRRRMHYLPSVQRSHLQAFIMHPKKKAFRSKMQAKDQTRIESVLVSELSASMLAVRREKRASSVPTVNVA